MVTSGAWLGHVRADKLTPSGTEKDMVVDLPRLPHRARECDALDHTFLVEEGGRALDAR